MAPNEMDSLSLYIYIYFFFPPNGRRDGDEPVSQLISSLNRTQNKPIST